MAISNCNKEVFLNHQALLMFINHLIEENVVSKSNLHVVEVIRTHEYAVKLMQESNSEHWLVSEEEIKNYLTSNTEINSLFRDNMQKVIESYLGVCAEMETLRNKMDNFELVLGFDKLANKFKSVRIKRKQLEEKYPLIKSYAKLTMAKQQHQCHAFL